MKKIHIFLFFVFFIAFFTAIFFAIFIFDYTTTSEEQYIEETYIEPELAEIPEGLEAPSLYEMVAPEREEAEKIIAFHFLPKSYGQEQDAQVYTALLQSFFVSDFIGPHIEELRTYMYKKTEYTRGRMRDKKIHMYAPTTLPREEFLAVGIHEFGHFLDLYILKKNLHFDVSDRFYNISWLSAKKLRPGMKSSDFVSGYAMTNKYEDFAETFTYYVLHNENFQKKAEKSPLLREKYNFFADYVFIHGEFQIESYQTVEKPKNYYWDTTKISYSLADFLIYLEGERLDLE